MNNWSTLDAPTLDAENQTGLTATSAPSQPAPYSPQQMDKKFAGTALLFIAGMAAMVALALGPSSAIEAYQIHDQLAHWPHTEAVVDHCESYYVYQRLANNEGTHLAYGMRCHVGYSVGSRQWKAAADLGYLGNDRDGMILQAHRFHPGDHIQIAYNPTFPDSVLFAGAASLAYAGPLWKGRIAFWCLLAVIVTLPFGFRLRSAASA